jgi:AcrR family transcriptional regulator
MSVAKVEGPVQARRGRPRLAATDEAIMAAAVQLIGEQGYDGFKMAAVAERAGVAKTTVYRRWPRRADLALATVTSVMARVTIVDSGDLRADLADFTRRLAAAYRSPGIRQLVGELAHATVRRREVESVFRRRALARRAAVIDSIRRAADAGQLRPDADPELILDQINGVLHYRLIVSGDGDGLSDAAAERLVDGILDGVLATSSA